MDRLKGKVAVVTGGGGGIGSATCRRFAEEGAKVAVLDIDLESAQAVAGSIPGSDALALRVDITNLENVEQSIEETEQQLGPVDILINNYRSSSNLGEITINTCTITYQVIITNLFISRRFRVSFSYKI